VTSQLHLRKAAVDEHLGMIRIKRFAGGAVWLRLAQRHDAKQKTDQPDA
jgi:hypothetical protein